MMTLPALLTLLAIFGFIVWVVSTFRGDGIRTEKLKNSEAINDQNDELLEYLKKEKAFIHSLKNMSPDELDRLRKQINDNQK